MAEDPIFFSIILFCWLFISAMVFLNLFIAMMSTTYQQVTDASIQYSRMCRAQAITTLLRDIEPRKRWQFERDILKQLDFESQGNELFPQESYDDQDEEPDDIPNLRKKLYERINQTHETISSLRDDIVASRAIAENNKHFISKIWAVEQENSLPNVEFADAYARIRNQ